MTTAQDSKVTWGIISISMHNYELEMGKITHKEYWEAIEATLEKVADFHLGFVTTDPEIVR